MKIKNEKTKTEDNTVKASDDNEKDSEMNQGPE